VIPCLSWPRAIAFAVVLVLVVSAPAAAHPSVRGGELPVDSLATLTLVTGHGCGSDHGGAEADTTQVVLEVPDWLRVIDVPADAPWKVELEDADAAADTPGTVTWATDAPAETAPDLDLEVVASGTEGEVRYLRVVQRCDDLTERWVGTPDDPADQPAVEVRLVAAVPSSPPPPEAAPDEPTDTADGQPEDAADGDASDEQATTDPEPVVDDAGEEGADPDAADAEVVEAPAADVADLAAVPAAEEAPSGWWLALLLVLAIVPLAVVLGRRRVQADAAAVRAAHRDVGTTDAAAAGDGAPDADTPPRP
jgi:hypothetical protein